MTITIEMREAVARVEKEIETVLREAMASGKPVTLLIGENHYDPNCALLDMLIYKKARELGVRDVAIEQPRESGLDKGEGIYISRGTPIGQYLLSSQALYYGDQLHLIDDCHTLATQSNFYGSEARNDNMAANLAPWKRPVLMLTGGDHVDGPMSSPGHETGIAQRLPAYGPRTIVKFKVSNESITVNKNGFSLTMTIGHISEGTHALSLVPSDARDLLTNELIELGMGKDEAQKFIPWAEGKGYKSSIYSALTVANELNNRPVEMLPPNTNFLYYTAALYELGRDAEAGKFYAYYKQAIHKNSAAISKLDEIDEARFSNAFKQAYAQQASAFADIAKTPNVSHGDELPIPLLHIKKPKKEEIKAPYVPR